MKIGICGHGRSGKDTAAEQLAIHTPMRYVAGTSYWARHLVYASISDHGQTYENAEKCWQDRHNHRQVWADIIGEYNRADPVKLYRDCLQDQEFLTGVRWLHEQRAIKDANLVDLWVWIENPRVPVDPTCQITKEDCDIVILNCVGLVQYKDRLKRFANFLNLRGSAP